jgi:hypothetical protein
MLKGKRGVESTTAIMDTKLVDVTQGPLNHSLAQNNSLLLYRESQRTSISNSNLIGRIRRRGLLAWGATRLVPG